MKLIGRDKEVEEIDDLILTWQSGLSMGGSPIGNFLLAGPSGSGKTRTVEYLAEKYHGHGRMMVKIDCGEFQLEHEVAKLIGAPPGYLGHRETTPILTQQKINACTSERCNVCFVLFDEIEKAAQSMQRLLLGVMDKAQLKLGDNTVCNFEKCVIFFTSNLGTKGLFQKNMYAFSPSEKTEVKDSEIKAAINGYFSIEFRNRLTNTFYYHPLNRAQCLEVVRGELEDMGDYWGRNIQLAAEFDASLCEAMLERGFSREFGGRELKRTIKRDVIVPLARHNRDEWKGRKMNGMHLRLGWNGALTIEVLEDNFLVAAGAATGRKGRK